MIVRVVTKCCLSFFKRKREIECVRKVNYFKEDCDLKPIMTGWENDANMCFIGFNLNLHIFLRNGRLQNSRLRFCRNENRILLCWSGWRTKIRAADKRE